MSIFRRIHTLGGIFIAPLMFVAALSGFFYALAPTIERGLYHQEMTADGGQAQSLDKQVDAARAVHPDLDIARVQSSDNPKATTRVLFADPDLPSKSYTHAVFVDPASLAIKGDLVQYGGSAALPFRTWLSQGHRSLWLGEPGRIYAEIAASWLAPFAITGLFLWWTTRKRTKKNATRAQSSRMKNVSRHSTIGVWIALGMLFLGASGLSWSLVAGDNIAAVREQLQWQTPSICATAPEHTDHGAGDHTTPDPAAANAHAEHAASAAEMGHADHHAAHAAQDVYQHINAVARQAGLTGVLDIKSPAEPGALWTVNETRQPFSFSTDAVAINPDTMSVANTLKFSDWPIAARLTTWAIQLHMGTLFGIYSQIALAVLALGLMAAIVIGYIMWFQRVRKNAARTLAPSFRWSQTSLGVRIALIAALIGYSIIAPLFAASLVVVILLGACIQYAGKRTSPRTSAE
ncbi:PepSY domain-containing protein [Corynebacterium sp. 321]|uniref:PepSY-associated TM helix domain-containing protein n=1 Tax=Corynebacterium sp. 321 TaxID=2651047 RepID=UPI001CE48972|nr:PepSY domain-containing protein [Corynebacterium sp. 321]